MEVFILIAAGVLLSVQLWLWHRKRRKLAGMLLNIGTGLAALLPVSLLGGGLPLNFATGLISCVLGAPGVCLMSIAVYFA